MVCVRDSVTHVCVGHASSPPRDQATRRSLLIRTRAAARRGWWSSFPACRSPCAARSSRPQGARLRVARAARTHRPRRRTLRSKEVPVCVTCVQSVNYNRSASTRTRQSRCEPRSSIGRPLLDACLITASSRTGSGRHPPQRVMHRAKTSCNASSFRCALTRGSCLTLVRQLRAGMRPLRAAARSRRGSPKSGPGVSFPTALSPFDRRCAPRCAGRQHAGRREDA